MLTAIGIIYTWGSESEFQEDVDRALRALMEIGENDLDEKTHKFLSGYIKNLVELRQELPSYQDRFVGKAIICGDEGYYFTDGEGSVLIREGTVGYIAEEQEDSQILKIRFNNQIFPFSSTILERWSVS